MTFDQGGPGTGARYEECPPPVAVAFCPCPPLLLPAVAGGAVAETSGVRAACLGAVDAMLSHRPEVVVVVGDGSGPGPWGPGDVGDLAGYGIDLRVPFAGPARPDGRRIPSAHAVGAWLLDERGHTGPRVGTPPAGLAGVLTGLPGTLGVLAMGDGSARRSTRAPGHLDAAAEPFDAAVAAALATGDAAALAALDPAEGRRLMASGVPTWRATGAVLVGRAGIRARLHAYEAPFGVGYLVADWFAA